MSASMKTFPASYILNSTNAAAEGEEGGAISLRLDMASDELEESVITLVITDQDLYEAFRDAGGEIEVLFTIPPPQDLTGVDLHPVMPISDREEDEEGLDDGEPDFSGPIDGSSEHIDQLLDEALEDDPAAT